MDSENRNNDANKRTRSKVGEKDGRKCRSRVDECEDEASDTGSDDADKLPKVASSLYKFRSRKAKDSRKDRSYVADDSDSDDDSDYENQGESAPKNDARNSRSKDSRSIDKKD